MRENVNNKQRIVIISPVLIIASMYPVFHLLAGALGETLGWYLGLITYWIIWGAVFPILIIGRDRIKSIVKPQKPDIKALILVLLLLVLAATFRYISGMEYSKPHVWIFIMLVSTNFGNGFFEEVLWRGLYMELFPNNLILRIVWPSIWFGLWHYAPGSVSSTGNAAGLMIGAGLMGFYLSFLAQKTGTIWWSILAHTIGGFIVII